MIGLAAVLVVLLAPMAVRADIVYVPARVSYYAAPAPVVSYPAPMVSYYQPSVSYYQPSVSYYAPAVSYYTPAVPVTGYRWGVFGRRLVPTYGYAAPVAVTPAPVYARPSYYYSPAPVVVYP
jgi:hypothetical protein